MVLEGKVALITGGGTGIGAAIARRFVADGAKVCIAGRRQEKLDETAGSLPRGSVSTCSGDVSKGEDIIRMVKAACGFGGRLDVLVNCAAMGQRQGLLVDVEPRHCQKVISVNLTGPFLLMKEAIPRMISAGGGSIINIASLAGIRSIPGMSAYCASKGALVALSRQVALDYGPMGVRCNVICPGAVRTEALEATMRAFAGVLKSDVDQLLRRFSQYSPLRRPALPDEITGPCSFLASDDSTFVTGVVIPIDGGASVVDISGAVINGVAPA